MFFVFLMVAIRRYLRPSARIRGSRFLLPFASYLRPSARIRGSRSFLPSGAFTLVELLVAAGLTSIFLLMVATIFSQGQGSISVAKASVAMSQEARAVFDLMARDLAAATLLQYDATPGTLDALITGYFRGHPGNAAYEYDPGAALGTHNPPGTTPTALATRTATDGGAPAYSGCLDLPRLYFVTLAPQGEAMSSAQGGAEPFVVSYQLIRSGKSKLRTAADGSGTPQPRGVFRLIRRVMRAQDESYRISTAGYNYEFVDLHDLDIDRRTDYTTGPDTTITGDNHLEIYSDATPCFFHIKSDPLAFNVLWIEYRFFDPATGAWTTSGQWDDTLPSANSTRRLPSAVEIRLTLTDPLHREESTYTSRFRVPAGETQ